MSFSNVPILSMYDVSWRDGWNDLSMSIGLMRYSPTVYTNKNGQHITNWNILANRLGDWLDEYPTW
jgi:hypothetical protein